MTAKTKSYTVVKDGEIIDKVKTLTAAKKIADAEGAEVYADGKCVYRGIISAAVIDSTVEHPTDVQDETVIESVKLKTSHYHLKALMNVREKPSIKSRVIATKPEGTIVTATGIVDDWLCLPDGGYILYDNGRWAEKAE